MKSSDSLHYVNSKFNLSVYNSLLLLFWFVDVVVYYLDVRGAVLLANRVRVGTKRTVHYDTLLNLL